MKKILLFISFMVALTVVKAQTYISADFTSATFPPSGWTIDAHIVVTGHAQVPTMRKEKTPEKPSCIGIPDLMVIPDSFLLQLI